MRVIDQNGENLGVLSKAEALAKAREVGLDLVLVSPDIDPPVAKIIDWSKFKYEQTKKAKNAKGHQVKNKEWWFKPNIADNDMENKLKRVIEFVSKGNTAKLTIKSTRRVPREQMYATMERLREMMKDKVEEISEVRKEGYNLVINVKKKS
ncbi:MAG: translation initiation factor IF-3 [Candidatus Dojkabacteria bacterium]|nr:MAG: translation initiation factor IF-3 [Candidatus Dojkabacteria bacterium]